MPLPPSEFLHAPPGRRHRLLIFARGALRAVIAVVLTLWSVLLLGWLTLHWGILPHIDDWRGTIERHASAAIGAPVHIGQIEVHSSGWMPAFELRDVTLTDRQGREALRLPKVSAAIAPQSLLALKLRFAQLHIDGAQLVVRRDSPGRWHVGGLDIDDSASLEGSAAGDWFFQQHEIVIQGGRLRWVDEMSRAAPLQLEQVQLVVRNGLRHHDLRLDATPAAAFGERFSLVGRFRQPLLARSGDWQRWKGSLHADLPYADAAVVREHLALPFELRSGVGAFRAWLDLDQGRWQAATVDLALSGVDLRLSPGLAAMAFERLQGRLAAQREGDRVQLSAEGFGFRTTDGLDWPASRAALAWRSPPQPEAAAWALPDPATLTGGELSADRIDLALLARLAERLPLPAQVRRALGELAPRGKVQDLQLSWTGSPEQPSRYRVQAKVSELSIAPLPSPEAGSVGRPGWRNADLTLDANETGGQAQLALKDGALLLPGVFADPEVPLDQFSSQLVWHLRPAPWPRRRPAEHRAAAAAGPLRQCRCPG